MKTVILGVQEVEHNLVSKYGIINPSNDYKNKTKSDIIPVKDVVEKPQPKDAPSDYAILGRYILNPEIFDELQKIKPDVRGELELTDAIFRLSKYQRVYAKVFSGRRYDIGSKFGFITATVEAALNHSDIKDNVEQLILKCAENIKKHKTTKNEKSRRSKNSRSH